MEFSQECGQCSMKTTAMRSFVQRKDIIQQYLAWEDFTILGQFIDKYGRRITILGQFAFSYTIEISSPIQ